MLEHTEVSHWIVIVKYYIFIKVHEIQEES